jgi:hypothetical protein
MQNFPSLGYLLSHPYDWVVTNIRLAAYNGLHLMHLAAAARLRGRFVVYADQQDVLLAREAQRAGAFYEARDQVHRALAVRSQRCRRTTAAMLTCVTAAASCSVAAAGSRMEWDLRLPCKSCVLAAPNTERDMSARRECLRVTQYCRRPAALSVNEADVAGRVTAAVAAVVR